ncbi:hypothetical protein CERZMDRAFT_120379 [Cercospora zeae-maydis SCOH1-5]|uniref:Exonuclease domain-containing protein n=1 Tax=Cercospora zeae-maydis SCOH1-5 TaxID=717836 RepID=A0A6A6FNI7_9PEZI|nr:hypothetical protein CERZMDRAFT_120379 [Cercospora zeae-maydis SCOH1-5]
MVFATSNLFKNVVCPKLREGAECNLRNCIYGHPAISPTAKPLIAETPATQSAQAADQDQGAEPPLKRRRVTYNSLEEKPPSRADVIRSQLAAQKAKPPAPASQSRAHVSQAAGPAQSPAPPQSLSKPVSPPPSARKVTSISDPPKTLAGPAANKNGLGHAASAPVKLQKSESLNPRLVASDPVGHARRSLLLKYLHAELVRLDQLVVNATSLGPLKDKLKLTPQQLIHMALDLEEKLVRESGSVYSNVIKSRIAAYRKMTLDAWVAELKITFVSTKSPPGKSPEKPIETGLSLQQEALILPQLVADQRPLAAHGYITTPPSAAQIAEAKAAVAASHNWEECDRCAARFQIFPNRNDKGLLTGNGPCQYHPRRKVFPQRTKANKDASVEVRGPYYPCCDEDVGTPGCTTQAEHVFNTKSPARLAAVLPFITTPENPSPAKDRQGRRVQAVTFDCEMGYTAYGLELIRLTALAWPTNEELIDVLVRPVGAIIDLNSRFSGVFPESYTNAVPYEQWTNGTPSAPPDEGETAKLPIVASPAKARELLCSFLTPQTPLIGHAIDNDLNTVRLCHPTIVDTVVLYPHPKGLPMRFGLKTLTQKYLNRQIQMGGDRGHDSKEDAIATGDLVRVKVGQKWKDMRITGWTIVNEVQLVPPPPPKSDSFKLVAFGTPASKKRRHRGSHDGANDGSDSEENEAALTDALKS